MVGETMIVIEEAEEVRDIATVAVCLPAKRVSKLGK
jgi:hypothetical protein